MNGNAIKIHWYAPKRDINQTFVNEVAQWLAAHKEDDIGLGDGASKKADDAGSKVSVASSALKCTAGGQGCSGN